MKDIKQEREINCNTFSKTTAQDSKDACKSRSNSVDEFRDGSDKEKEEHEVSGTNDENPLLYKTCNEKAHKETEASPEVYFTKAHLQFINRQLQHLEPQEILRWSVVTLPRLYQTTGFGLTGLVTLDMLSKLNVPNAQTVDLIFLDTLHHFPETLTLLERIKNQYPSVKVHVFKPAGLESQQEFEQKYGQKLWENDEKLYDWAAKVEPAQRAYRELRVNAVLTGRRRSQGGKRGELDIVEVDEAGLIKVNPFSNWTFEEVQEYIKTNNVPYNELLDRGYKSIGDWHSTQPIKEGEDERAGRWKDQEKTECGIHNPRSRYYQFLLAKEKKKKEQQQQQQVAPGEASCQGVLIQT